MNLMDATVKLKKNPIFTTFFLFDGFLYTFRGISVTPLHELFDLSLASGMFSTQSF
ncbi:hypothetical protein VB10N_29820 [Vibrio sp. 10N]|nr:hypothetical protein VB10N_29820 [Vibrio sp. 10N]